MSYSKVHTDIVYENSPSVATPLNATNLNYTDHVVDILDDRIVALDTAKAGQSDLLQSVKDITYNTSTGVIHVVWWNGSTYDIDLNIEKIPVSFSMDASGVIKMVTADGTEYTADISTILKLYTFVDSDEIDFTVTQSGNNYSVTASIKDGSITEDKLQPDFLADCKTARDGAVLAANSASSSKYVSEGYANGTADGEAITDPTSPYYHNNAKWWKEQAEAVASQSLAGLTDVEIDTPQNGQALVYDADSGKWVNGDGGSSITVVDNLTSTSATDALSAKQGNVLDKKKADSGFTIFPSGYTRLSYIECTEQQYVDTGITDATHIEVDFVASELGLTSSYLFSYSDYAPWNASAYLNYNVAQLSLGAGNVINFNESENHTFRYEINSMSGAKTATISVDGGASLSRTITEEYPYNRLLLFASQDSEQSWSPTKLWKGKVSEVRIYNTNDELIRRYIPAENSSGYVGLYELETESFVRSGSGVDFVGGAVVPTKILTLKDVDDKVSHPTALLIGDSLGVGKQDGTGAGWCGHLSDISNMNCVANSLGSVGFYAQGSGKRFIDLMNASAESMTDKEKENLQKVIVFGGANDFMNSVSIADIDTYVTAFVSRARKLFPNAIIYVVPLNTFVRLNNAQWAIANEIAIVARNNGCVTTNAFITNMVTDDQWAYDNIHYTDAGYVALAGLINSWLNGGSPWQHKELTINFSSDWRNPTSAGNGFIAELDGDEIIIQGDVDKATALSTTGYVTMFTIPQKYAPDVNLFQYAYYYFTSAVRDFTELRISAGGAFSVTLPSNVNAPSIYLNVRYKIGRKAN